MRQFPKSFRKKFHIFKNLDSPQKVQDFLDTVPINFEPRGDTLRSPRMVLKHGEAHCIEGALLASAALWYHGEPPLLLDLKTFYGDYDHVVALFKVGDRWGAISKTNHVMLRYRDPVYASVRELAMSYFNEYFLRSGKKTMRSFSEPFDLSAAGNGWLTSRRNLWNIERALDDSPHEKILTREIRRSLRHAGPIEIEAGKITEWKKIDS